MYKLSDGFVIIKKCFFKNLNTLISFQCSFACKLWELSKFCIECIASHNVKTNIDNVLGAYQLWNIVAKNTFFLSSKYYIIFKRYFLVRFSQT